MIIADTLIDSVAVKKAIDYINQSYWEHGDFWWGIGLAIVGFLISGWAVYEARSAFNEASEAKDAATAAKTAAQEAAKTVHKQDIIIILTEILNECQLNPNIQYNDASLKHKLILKKIKFIRGLYSQYLNEDQLKFLVNIEASLDLIRTTLDLFNSAISGGNTPPPSSSPDYLSLSLDSSITTLAGNLELLKGSLTATLV